MNKRNTQTAQLKHHTVPVGRTQKVDPPLLRGASPWPCVCQQTAPDDTARPVARWQCQASRLGGWWRQVEKYKRKASKCFIYVNLCVLGDILRHLMFSQSGWKLSLISWCLLYFWTVKKCHCHNPNLMACLKRPRNVSVCVCTRACAIGGSIDPV